MGCDSTNKNCKNNKKKITAPKDNNLNIDIKNKVDSNIKLIKKPKKLYNLTTNKKTEK